MIKFKKLNLMKVHTASVDKENFINLLNNNKKIQFSNKAASENLSHIGITPVLDLSLKNPIDYGNFILGKDYFFFKLKKSKKVFTKSSIENAILHLKNVGLVKDSMNKKELLLAAQEYLIPESPYNEKDIVCIVNSSFTELWIDDTSEDILNFISVHMFAVEHVEKEISQWSLYQIFCENLDSDHTGALIPVDKITTSNDLGDKISYTTNISSTNPLLANIKSKREKIEELTVVFNNTFGFTINQKAEIKSLSFEKEYLESLAEDSDEPLKSSIELFYFSVNELLKILFGDK